MKNLFYYAIVNFCLVINHSFALLHVKFYLVRQKNITKAALHVPVENNCITVMFNFVANMMM